MNPNQASITRQVYESFIRTTPAQLWAALTDPKSTPHYFFGTCVESSFESGAPIAYNMPGGPPAVSGTILECDRGRRLVHTWKIEYDPSLSNEVSTVTYLIEARGPLSKLTVVHDLDKAPGTAAHLGAGQDGWNVVLSSLKTLLETGTPLEVPPAAQA